MQHCQQATVPGIGLDGSRHAGCLAISLRDIWPSGIAVLFFMPVVLAMNAPCALTGSRNVGLYRACGFRLMALPFHMKGGEQPRLAYSPLRNMSLILCVCDYPFFIKYLFSFHQGHILPPPI